MAPPALIEFTFFEDGHVYLVFQSKSNPILAEEMRGREVVPKTCPDDGTMFLEGCPEDYLDHTIRLETLSEFSRFTLENRTLHAISNSKRCSYGGVVDAGDGGNGPGLTFDGRYFMRDESLGVSTGSMLSQRSTARSLCLELLIHREHENKRWKYYDEDNLPNEGTRSTGDAGEGSAPDVCMGDSDEQADGDQDELVSSMKTLRLKRE